MSGGGAWFARHPLAVATDVAQQAAPFEKAPVIFPTAPFHADEFRDGTWAYVNQFGYALLKHQPFDHQHRAGLYDLFFDDDGAVTVTAKATVPVDLAFYNATPSPTQTDTRGLVSAGVSAMVGPEKHTLYVAVQPHDPARAKGLCNLQIFGVPVRVWDTFTISPKSNLGQGETSISGPNDFDFWRFTVSVAGTWLITVKPAGTLDATMTVFDGGGVPIGGTFTQPIDNAGPGGTESFMQTMAAGQTAVVRVDGAGDSVGNDYVISARLASQAWVSVRATAAGTFTISSSARVRRALGVHYLLSGTAANGVDYQVLSGVAWIPAGQASVAVKPICNSGAAGKSVVLTVDGDPRYQVGAPASAAVTLGTG